MANFKLLIVAAAAAAFMSNANAFYVTLSPPVGFSSAGAVNTYNFARSASLASTTIATASATSAASTRGSVILANAAINVGGRAVAVPVGMRLAANAAMIGSKFSFGNPAIFAASILVPIAWQWYVGNGQFLIKDGVWGKIDQGNCGPSGKCYLYRYVNDGKIGQLLPSMPAACQSLASVYNSTTGSSYTGSLEGETCFLNGIDPISHNAYKWGGWDPIKIPVDTPTSSFSPVSESEFVGKMAPLPIPDKMPEETPTVDWPVEQPVLNPGPDGNPTPFFIPSGNPVPTPDPNVWNQPGIRVVPAPTPDSPFRVDLQPENIPQNSPVPKTPAELNPVPTPSSPASAPVSVPVPSDKLGLCDQYPGIAACAPAAPPEAKTKFCEENPDVLACQKTDTPDVPDMKEESKDISITPDSGWGEGGGSCPAPRKLSKSEISFQPICDFASGVRPVVIAVAWLTAAGMLLGFGKGDE